MNSTTSTNTNPTTNTNTSSTVNSSMNSRPTPRLTSTVTRVLALSTPVTHQIYAGLRWCRLGRGRTLSTASDVTADGRRLSGDRGAVSLEPVLWFVASGSRLRHPSSHLRHRDPSSTSSTGSMLR